MKNTTLLFRSLAVIILIAGIAHLASFMAQSNDTMETETYEDESQTASKDSLDHDISPEGKTSQKETDYLIGKWQVAYDLDDFKGTIVYDLKKEGDAFNAYTDTYYDENGYSEKAERIKTLTLHNFNGYKGEGTYTLEYQGKHYPIACQIDMVDSNTFVLSYDYYGEIGSETWKRQRP